MWRGYWGRLTIKPTIPKYVALGDSITISDYPYIDSESRFGRRITQLGAAALTYMNNDELFTEFRGHDLRSLLPGLQFVELASDGATLPDVERQIARIDNTALIISLTVGGNDLLEAYGSSRSRSELETHVEQLCDEYQRIVAQIRQNSPWATLILNTVYDPSDGTGNLPGFPAPLPLRLLDCFNATVHATAAKYKARVADIHRHFLGHGISVPVEERWYWSGHIIEPSVEGAHEVRRLWIEIVANSTSHVKR